MRVGETVHKRRLGFILVCFLNHENMKLLEFHEIFESRISLIILDFTEKYFVQRDSFCQRFLSFFRVFYFSFRVFAIQSTIA